MNKAQKRLAVFLFILSLTTILITFKVTKLAAGKKQEIGRLSQKVTVLTKDGRDLKGKVEKQEKELAAAKQDMENITYKLKDEEKRKESFREKYKSEEQEKNDLQNALKELKTAHEKEIKIKEELSQEIEKIKEEKGRLSERLELAKQEKDVLEAFVAEDKEKSKGAFQRITEASIGETPGKIFTVYPQGLLAVELEKSYYDKIKPGKILRGQREIKISNIYSHMIIFEIAEGEDASGFNKGDVIRYVR
jgi:septal ring factor EnvC (AmiA/AmiB activator)